MKRGTPEWVDQQLRSEQRSRMGPPGAAWGNWPGFNDLAAANAALPDASPEAPEYRVELTAALAKGGTCTAKITQKRNAVWVTSATEITIEDVVGTMIADSGAIALVRWNRQAQSWIIWQLACRLQ